MGMNTEDFFQKMTAKVGSEADDESDSRKTEHPFKIDRH